MRAGGYLLASQMSRGGDFNRFLRLAPGNFFAAFIASGCFAGGLPSFVGATIALIVMICTAKDWLAVAGGFAAAMAVVLSVN
jgi:hypothetical protein